MKKAISIAVFSTAAAWALAQTGPPANDPSLNGLTTPLVLGKDKLQAGLQFNTFGGSDKAFRTNLDLGYGLGCGWEADLAATFASFAGFTSSSGTAIRYGGSAGALVLKYKLPTSFESSLQAGLAYANTPAQPDRGIFLLGGSAGYGLSKEVRVYVNPQLVSIDRNSLLGLGFGAIGDIYPKISLYGTWTPLLSGDNTLSTADGSRARVQLYTIGVRLSDLSPGLAVDLGFTNTVGQTAGFSLTPSLGNTGGAYVGLAYRF